MQLDLPETHEIAGSPDQYVPSEAKKQGQVSSRVMIVAVTCALNRIIWSLLHD